MWLKRFAKARLLSKMLIKTAKHSYKAFTGLYKPNKKC